MFQWWEYAHYQVAAGRGCGFATIQGALYTIIAILSLAEPVQILHLTFGFRYGSFPHGFAGRIYAPWLRIGIAVIDKIDSRVIARDPNFHPGQVYWMTKTEGATASNAVAPSVGIRSPSKCDYWIGLISTRRFLARPSLVVLDAMGRSGPNPLVVILEAAIP